MESPPPLPGTERQTPLQMEIAFINVNVPYQSAISILFSEMPLCLLFLKYNGLKIILMLKRYVLEWHILLLFSSFRGWVTIGMSIC